MTDHKPKPNTARPGGSHVIEAPKKSKTQKPAPDEGAQQKEEVTENAD